ncbi:TetR/AcrR family transcriptional regulator [Streptomyces coeruleorubidus]|uniref:TetR/AcrR family transcriptional regulator n=1 Tax=Streptomyces coeruleorubidus TaxID=116188 RepID=A0A5J6I327_STRC4|nr:TetR/AcrR family transcriptional regulator [Streptomyces coeruleorubidus]QEV24990.1 TetR/AcrR family transcriptional regulator [Streptomyces coeruleorubidus]GGT54496.1 TetR family transcriptional regulator [Streptomyces coeruleorubidus]
MSLAERHPRPDGPPRGRPRSEAVERAIVEGVMRLLEEGVPLAELSIERIARTAGVGKATIYRRWSGKEELFADVLRATEPPGPPLPGTSTRDDLVALLEQARRRGLAKRSSAILTNVHAQMKSSPKIWAAYEATVLAPRRRQGLEILRRGQENGELRTDVDIELLSDMFIGPVLVRSVLRPDADLPDDLAAQVVDTLLEGLRPVSSAAHPS